MALTTAVKAKIRSDFGSSDKDSGSTEVQIAQLTQRITDLTKHCTEFKKDFSTKYGLMCMVSQRRKLLSYLQRTKIEKYQQVVAQLNLRIKK